MIKVKNPKIVVPSEYTQLEYIQSSGTQYIVVASGITLPISYRVKTQGTGTSSNTQIIVSAGDGSSAYWYGIVKSTNVYGVGTTSGTYSTVAYNTVAEAIISQSKNSSNYGIISGTINSESVAITGTTVESTNNLELLGIASSSIGFIGKMFYFYAYDSSNNLIYALIPAKRNSDSVIGMYDTVSQTFFTNAGTGTFTAGDEVSPYAEMKEMYKKNPASHNLPSGYTELEYIENTTNNCWFNTGIVTITDKTVVEVKGYVTNGSSVFGGNGTTSGAYFNCTSITNSVIPFRYGSNYYNCSTTNGEFFTTPATIKFGNYKMYINGELKNTMSESAFTYSSYTLKIWGRTSGPSDMAIGRIYFANVYNEDTPQFQGIPARQESDSAIGLYDLVSDAFIANSGSGTFTAGPEVENYEYIEELYKKNSSYHGLPSEYTEVEPYEHVFSGGYDTTVMGNPVTMSNARAKSLTYEFTGNTKRTIEIDGTEYDVPDGYTMLEYITGDGNSYIDTGLYYTSRNIEVKTKVNYVPRDTEMDIFGIYVGDGGAVIGNYHSKIFQGSYPYDSNTYSSAYSGQNTLIIDAIYNYTNSTKTLTVNGTTTTENYTADITATTTTLRMFSGNTISSYRFNGSIYYLNYYEDGVLKMVMIPAKNSSDVLGMYDFVSNTFFTNAGTGTFTAGNELPTPDANLGVKGVGDISKNLFDIATIKDGYFIRAGNTSTENPLGSEGTSSSWSCSDYIPVSPSTTYTVTYPYYQSATAAGLVYFTDKTVASAISGVTTNAQGSTVYTFTTPATCNYVRFSWNHTQGNNCQLEVGSSSTTIVSHYQFPLLHAENCGVVDLGTLSWTYGGSSYNMMWANVPSKAYSVTNQYLYGYTQGSSWSTLNDMEISGIGTLNRIYIRNDSYGTDPDVFKSMVSGKYLFYQRTTDDTWTEPTISNIYDDSQLYKVGTYADTIGSDGTRTNNIACKVLDGTETWGMDYGTGMFHWHKFTTDAITGASMCTHFIYHNVQSGLYSGLSDGEYSIQKSAAQYNIFIKHLDCSTISDWTTYLAAQYSAGTPVTIWYLLATPTTETITTPSITNVKETNYLQTQTDLKPSELSATYRKKTK